MHPFASADAPVGTICAYAGSITPVSTAKNTVWASSACAASSPVPAQPASSSDPAVLIEAQGWMACDGRLLPAAKYPELFAVLGYWYGGSNGSFRIPDCRGLFLRGVDYGAGLDPDAASRLGPAGTGTSAGVGSLQCDALQTHVHQYGAVPVSGVSEEGNAAGTPPASQLNTSDPIAPARTTVETRPKNIAVNFIIKFSTLASRPR